MINHIVGDVLAIRRGVIVHGCNCIGVMGAGVALQVALKWPKIERHYRELCAISKSEQLLGKIDVHKLGSGDGLFLVNAFTQLEPGGGKQVSYDAMAECFRRISIRADMFHLPICFPLIGCGLAGGKWPIVAAIIDEQLPMHTKQLYIK